MRQRGLSGKAVADILRCPQRGCARLLVAEAIPHPRKQALLASTLKRPIERQRIPDEGEPPAPVIAYRTKKQPTRSAAEKGTVKAQMSQ